MSTYDSPDTQVTQTLTHVKRTRNEFFVWSLAICVSFLLLAVCSIPTSSSATTDIPALRLHHDSRLVYNSELQNDQRLSQESALIQNPHLNGDAPSENILIRITKVTPHSVSDSSSTTLTVSGVFVNVSAKPISSASLRVQRAQPVRKLKNTRTVLTDDETTYDVHTRFHEISVKGTDEGQRLAPGGSAPFTVQAPLVGSLPDSLKITTPGVYPVLVNINGSLNEEPEIRLGAARFLLPVISLPKEASAQDPAQPNEQFVEDKQLTALPGAQKTRPRPMTLLWPLAAPPQQIGGDDSTTVLRTDTLASSLAPGGRLYSLLTAAEGMSGTAVDSTYGQQSGLTSLGEGFCLGVDPDLLDTVSRMGEGYEVLNKPDNIGGSTHSGVGKDAATAWLQRLSALAKNICLIVLPWAQADLTAITSGISPAYANRLLEESRTVVESILKIKVPQSSVLWPAGGATSQKTLDGLSSKGTTHVLLNEQNITNVRDTPSTDDQRTSNELTHATEERQTVSTTFAHPLVGRNKIVALPFSSVMSSALTASGTSPENDRWKDSSSTYNPWRDSSTARLQDLLGTLTWESYSDSPRPLLIVPPHVWSLSGQQVSVFTSTLVDLVASREVSPLSFDKLLKQTGASPTLSTLKTDSLSKTQLSDFSYLRHAFTTTTDLEASLRNNREGNLTSSTFLMPLRHDEYRATCLTGWSAPPRVDLAMREFAQRESSHQEESQQLQASTPSAAHAANQRSRVYLTQIRRSLRQIDDAITLIPPAGVYTMASSTSPLILVARNNLPVPIRVRLRAIAPEGVRLDSIGIREIPARGSISLQVPANTTHLRGRAQIRVSLSTAEGTPLGEHSDITIQSNAMGSSGLVFTVAVGVLLLALVAGRVYRRGKKYKTERP